MLENLLNQQKIFFFNAIKSEETAKTYKEFMKKDENSKKKWHHRTPKNRKKIKANFNLMKLKTQAEILEDKTNHYKTKNLEN